MNAKILVFCSVLLGGQTVWSQERLLQTIEWSSPSTNTLLLFHQAYPLSATASSGLPVTFHLESGPAIVAGATVTATNLGRIVIVAEQAGNATYAAARITRAFNPEVTGYLEKLSIWPGLTRGKTYDLKVEGAIAYLAIAGQVGVGLFILDISNPAQPVYLGSTTTQAELPQSMSLEVAGPRAYLCMGYLGMRVFDIRNPAKPSSIVSSWKDAASSIEVQGAEALIATGSGLQRVDVSNPDHLVPIGSRINVPCSTFKIVGSLLYSAGGPFGLTIVDLSNPAQPVELGRLPTFSAIAVDVVGSLAFVADYTKGLKIIDVSNPAQPKLAGTYFDFTAVYDVQVVGSFACLATEGDGLRVVDISNAAAPSLVGTFKVSSPKLQLVGRRAYLAAGARGVQIVEIGATGLPSYLGGYDTLLTPERIELQGHTAFLAMSYGRLRQEMLAIDVTDPRAPVPRPPSQAGPPWISNWSAIAGISVMPNPGCGFWILATSTIRSNWGTTILSGCLSIHGSWMTRKLGEFASMATGPTWQMVLADYRFWT